LLIHHSEALYGPRKCLKILHKPVAHTSQATLELFPQETHTLTPSLTIEDVFATVSSGAASHGVVPFENSSNGAVVFTLDLFADRASKYPSISVCGENYISVHHCLLGRKGASRTPSSTSTAPSSGAVTPTPAVPNPGSTTKPLQDLSHVTSLHSHPQAWGQCKRFLSTYLKGVDRVDQTSTSAAAALVASDATGSSAAVCSALAAEVYGLDILARDIEDESTNQTRFLVIRKGGEADSGLGSGKRDVDGEAEGRSWKSLLTFTPSSHSNPGALADALGVFKTHGINLTSINTRPSGDRNWEYIFFVEFSGRKGDRNVDQALEEIRDVVGHMRFLGSWESKTG